MFVQCDIAIIGAGSGGLSLAAGAAQLGLSVILVEKALMGGDCLNYGCVPSKALLAAAKRYWQSQNSQILGTIASDITLDFTAVMQHVKQVIATISVHDSVARFESLGVRVIQETGHFLDKTTLMAGEYAIQAKHFVVATGSRAAIPPIPGLDTVSYLTNETLFDLTELPAHLVIVGGGPVGCEMAQAFAMLGSQVTLLEGMKILRQDDENCVAVVRESLQETGVIIHEGITVNAINQRENHIQIHTDVSIFEATHLLIATGRKPNVEALDCEKAGISIDKKGIVVDKRLRSTNKRIFAIGDVAGKMQFTHVANDHAGIVLRNIAFKLPATVKETAIPWVTYTEPELAHVGKTEKQCLEEGITPVELVCAFNTNDRAQAEQEMKGFIKVWTNKKGKILGVSIVGHLAGELLLPWVMAMREGKTLRVFTDTIIAYPTLSEISKRVAGQFYAPKLFSTTVKKIVKWLSWL